MKTSSRYWNICEVHKIFMLAIYIERRKRGKRREKRKRDTGQNITFTRSKFDESHDFFWVIWLSHVAERANKSYHNFHVMPNIRSIARWEGSQNYLRVIVNYYNGLRPGIKFQFTFYLFLFILRLFSMNITICQFVYLPVVT